MPVHVTVFERDNRLAEQDVFQAVCAEEGFVWERLSSDATFVVEADKSPARVAVAILGVPSSRICSHVSPVDSSSIWKAWSFAPSLIPSFANSRRRHGLAACLPTSWSPPKASC